MGVDVSLLSGFAIHDPSLEPTATDHPDGKMACGHRFEEAWRRRGGCIWFVRQAGDNEMARVRELAPHWGLVRGNKP